MNRLKVVQYLLNKISGKTYLEIGVELGESFCPIIAQRKIAVDPMPASPRVRAHLLQHPGATYYQTTSDAFFARKGRNFEDQKIDVALVDGLHTYAQSLKDVENCLRHLSSTFAI
ncbi:MAG TPA: class I SAM-dependent methyltransferase [Sedimentisphaerales bacterium]|nr:class I SAM-dependent methyltransferase [Sedimentisphaerales bacterium]